MLMLIYLYLQFFVRLDLSILDTRIYETCLLGTSFTLDTKTVECSNQKLTNLVKKHVSAVEKHK